MFEVITQSQPHDYQSLEILKEAYSKLGRDTDALNTSKRIAQAYVDMGQYSSAIMEYETILQRFPEDPDVQEALRKIESQANALEVPTPDTSLISKSETPPTAAPTTKSPGLMLPQDYEDGRRAMEKIFVETKLVAPADFEECWRLSSPVNKASLPAEPFVQLLQDRNLVPVEKSLKLISDRSRVAFVPLATYDIDIDMARTYPKDICRRWCILPVDRMSKSIFVATANPFNQQAATELAQATNSRLLWYLVPPNELVRMLQKVFR